MYTIMAMYVDPTPGCLHASQVLSTQVSYIPSPSASGFKRKIGDTQWPRAFLAYNRPWIPPLAQEGGESGKEDRQEDRKKTTFWNNWVWYFAQLRVLLL